MCTVYELGNLYVQRFYCKNILFYLGGAGDGQADAQVIDCQLQEEGAEGLSRSLLNAWQLVYHLFCGHVDVFVER